MPAGPQDMREHLAEKYRTTPEQSVQTDANMVARGEELGFEFFEDGRMHNTFNTHQLLHWANAHDHKHDLKQALFTAHFTNEIL
jgi:predicted DsbA family dithiol-disulfide isomerase